MALATNTSPGEIVLAGDLGGSNNGLAPELTDVGITAGSYTLPTVTVDAKGRITSIASGSISDATTSSKGVVQISTGLEVTGGVISVPAGESASLGIVKSGDVNHITITAGDIDTGPNIADITTQNTFTKAQNTALSTLTFATNIVVDASLSNVFTVTLTGNATLNTPSNLVAGGHYTFFIVQDGTGGRTLSFSSAYKFKNGFSSTISTGANIIDIITCISDGTNLYCALAKEFV